MELTKKEQAEKARIDRAVIAGKATRAQLSRGFALLRKLNFNPEQGNQRTAS